MPVSAVLALAALASLLLSATAPPDDPAPPEPDTICIPYIGCINV